MSSRSTVAVLTLLVAGVAARPEPPVGQYLPPNQLYGPPQNRPGIGGGSNPLPGQGGSGQYLPPNQQYGPPGVGSGYGDNGNNAPAQYSFQYMVNDPESRNDFGHKENRDGDMTRGMYYVLLPDGRRQTVEYEADRNGYRPMVTYTQEGPAFGGGSYPGGGYPAAGYPGGSGGYRY